LHFSFILSFHFFWIFPETVLGAVFQLTCLGTLWAALNAGLQVSALALVQNCTSSARMLHEELIKHCRICMALQCSAGWVSRHLQSVCMAWLLSTGGVNRCLHMSCMWRVLTHPDFSKCCLVVPLNRSAACRDWRRSSSQRSGTTTSRLWRALSLCRSGW
jgi:hypothetical protein